eukprot:PhM_4_TR478/c1_g1_i2/m.27590
MCVFPDCGARFSMSQSLNEYSAFLYHLEKNHLAFDEWCLSQSRNQTTLDAQNHEAQSIFLEWMVDHSIPRAAILDPRFMRVCKGFFSAPSPDKLRRMFLDGAKRHRSSVASRLRGAVSLAVDSGTHHGLKTTACVLVNGGEAIAWSCPEQTQASEQGYVDLLKEELDALKESAVNVKHVVSDNAAAIKNAARSLCCDRGMYFTACACHTLQLAVNFYMKQTNFASATEEFHNLEVWKPCQTRWWSSIDCLQRVANDDGRPLDIRAKADRILKQYKTTRLVGRSLERDDCSIIQAVNLWMRLMEDVSRDFALVLRDRLFRMLEPVHVFLACVANPAVDWVGTRQMSFLKEIAVTFLRHLLKGDSRFEADRIEDDVNVMLRGEYSAQMKESLPKFKSMRRFWGDADMFERVPAVAQGATLCCDAVASEASCERFFSGLKYIYTDLRTNLSHEQMQAEAVMRGRSKKSEKRERSDETDESFFEKEWKISFFDQFLHPRFAREVVRLYALKLRLNLLHDEPRRVKVNNLSVSNKNAKFVRHTEAPLQLEVDGTSYCVAEPGFAFSLV